MLKSALRKPSSRHRRDKFRCWRLRGPGTKGLVAAVELNGDRVLANIARLAEVIEPEAKALGFELVRIKMTGSGDERALQIMAEDPATGQLVVAQCADLSRRISSAIDTVEEGGEELIAGAYMLEVSSPGIDRPLTRAKDFTNWAGHEAKVALSEKLDGRRTLSGEIIGLEGDILTIDDAEAGHITVPLDKIHSAQLVLTDKLIAATQPLDMSDAEEIETLEEEKADS